MKTLMFAIPTNCSGGAERVITTVANFCAQNGHKVYFVNFDKDSDMYYIDPKVEVIKMGIGFGNRLKWKKWMKIPLVPYIELKRILYVLKLLKRLKPDIVVAFMETAEIIFGLCSVLLRIPFVSSLRNDLTASSGVHHIIRKALFPKAKMIVCQTEKVEMDAHPFYNCLTTMIPNPISPWAVNKHDFIGMERSRRIIAVGRLSGQKNYIMMIDAFAMIADKIPDYVLDIYGEGADEHKLRSYVKKTRLCNQITFHGVVKNALSVNNDASLYVMSSNFEGFPNALVEAMANGIPAICTDFNTNAARELLGSDGERGLLVPVKDTLALSQAMLQMLHDRNYAEACAKKAKEFVMRYQQDEVCRQWMLTITE